jgi:hypothetical protein
MDTGEAGAMAALLKARGAAATASDEVTVRVVVTAADGEYDVETGELVIRPVGDSFERTVTIWGALPAVADHILRELNG